MSKTCLVITKSLKQENFLHRSISSATMSESSPVSEQSGEGPSKGGISRSDSSAGTAEQSSEGPGNGGKARSATGKEEKARPKDSRRKVHCDHRGRKGTENQDRDCKGVQHPKEHFDGLG